MLVLVALVGARDALASLGEIGPDGWYTWQVDAVEDAPNWCCYGERLDRYYGGGCDIEDLDTRFSSFDSDDQPVQQMQVYVQMSGGAVRQVQTLGDACPIQSDSDVRNLGRIEAEESMRWLERVIEPHSRNSTQALGSIAVHAGMAAQEFLVGVADNGDEIENRKDAVFWLGQVRAKEAESDIVRLMFDDPDPELREHAAFSLSQSVAPGRVGYLARLGREDAEPEVRSQAWFWLAQTDAADAAGLIQRAIREESDPGVREDAVFALSQLPGTRAEQALVDIIEDKDLHEDIRKEALFWLAQVETDSALAYIDRLLNGS